MKKHRIIRTKGQRIAWTNTSRVPDEEIVAAIKYVAQEIDLDKVIVHFKSGSDRSGTAGRAYPYIPTISNTEGLERREWRYLIIVRSFNGNTKLGSYTMSTLGHEAKHVEQFRRGTLRREKKARNCEAQANAFGHWIAQRWVAA